MQLHTLRRGSCHMVKIRPESDRFAWLYIGADDQQTACTTYAVQLRMTRGHHLPQMHSSRLTCLMIRTTIEAEFLLDLRS